MGKEDTVATATPTSQDVSIQVAPTNNLPAVVEPVKVSAEKPGDLLPLSRLTADDYSKIEAIEKSVSFDDASVALTFGASVQVFVSETLNTLLRDVKTEDAGVAGDLAIELASGIKDLSIKEMREELKEWGVDDGDKITWKKIARAVPVFGKSFRHIEYFLERKQTLAKQFEQIQQKADTRKRTIIEYQVKLERQQEVTRTQLIGLMHHIIAGERILLAAVKDFNTFAAQPDIARDPIALADLQALRDRIIRFDVRLMKLKAAYVEASQLTLKQIGLIKSAGEIEIQNIFDVLLSDLPRMQATILNLAAAISIQRSQRDTKRQRDASAQIQEVAVDVVRDTVLAAKESEGDVLSQVEKLAAMTIKMTETMELAQVKERESAEKRREAGAILAELVAKMSAKEKEFTVQPLSVNS
ncbi:MAG: toxic anion resistance protein [Parcubacteria group bacterium]|nr:toxic anion resistance protein [Parcubacteria group bacterium]